MLTSYHDQNVNKRFETVSYLYIYYEHDFMQISVLLSSNKTKRRDKTRLAYLSDDIILAFKNRGIKTFLFHN